MLYVKMPKDLREYKQKVALGRTSQELFWIVLALIVGGLVFGICYVTVGSDVGSYATMASAIPIFLCGFVSIQDMTTLEFLKKVLKFYKSRQYLPYHNDLFEQPQKKKKPTKEERKFRKQLKKMDENC